MGASSVVGVARKEKYFQLAKQFGFSSCFKDYAPDLQEHVTSHQKHGNKILLFAPPECLDKVLSLLLMEGKIFTIGLYEGPWNSTSSLNVEEFIFKRASLTGVFAYPNLFFKEAIAHIRKDAENLTKMISHVICLETLPETFKDMANNPSLYFKTIFTLTD